jgi:hypothetical protein
MLRSENSGRLRFVVSRLKSGTDMILLNVNILRLIDLVFILFVRRLLFTRWHRGFK